MPWAGQPKKQELIYVLGKPTLIASPDYPAEALKRELQAHVDVNGTIRPDGRLMPERVVSSSTEPAFEKAVLEVLPFWRFAPDIERETCFLREAPGHVRLWFEIEVGKPKVSISQERPVPTKSASAAALPPQAPAENLLERINPVFPRSAIWQGVTEATVAAYLSVLRSGKVGRVTILPASSRPDFDDEVSRALSKWKFAESPHWPPEQKATCMEVVVTLSLVPRPPDSPGESILRKNPKQ